MSEDLQQILSQLSSIAGDTRAVKESIDVLLRWKERMDERCKHHIDNTGRINKTLYGNSGDGLVSEVQRLKNCKENVKDSAAQWKSFILGVLRTLVSTGVILLFLWLMSMYKSHGTS